MPLPSRRFPSPIPARKFAAAPVLGFAIALACAGSTLDARADGQDRIRAKDTFAVVWERLQNSGFKGEHEGLDWGALKTEHQADIENARDIETLRREINELLNDLKASHLVLLPAEATHDDSDDGLEDDDLEGAIEEDDAGDDRDDDRGSATKIGSGFGEVGLRFAVIDGRLRVERVAERSPAHSAGVRPGWAVERIGGFDTLAASAALQAAAPEARLRGETYLLMGARELLNQRAPGERIAVRFRDGAGKLRKITLNPVASASIESLRLPGIPPMSLHYSARAMPMPQGGCALHVEFSQWAMPVFDKLLESLRAHGDCGGVVIDLRGNTGGMVGALSAVGGLFLDKPTSLGTLSTGGGDLKLTALPRIVDNAGRDIRRFSGPVAILIDGASISCSDIFPASMQALKRARVFGSRNSAGMALPAASTPLPSGDRLLYPIAEFVDPIGRRIEGVGAAPDQIVSPTVEALSAGRDPVLDAALTWFASAPKAVAAPNTNAALSPSSSTSH
jgi:carboxyl-terminal processing protease